MGRRDRQRPVPQIGARSMTYPERGAVRCGAVDKQQNTQVAVNHITSSLELGTAYHQSAQTGQDRTGYIARTEVRTDQTPKAPSSVRVVH